MFLLLLLNLRNLPSLPPSDSYSPSSRGNTSYFLCLILPAILSSLTAGGIAPFMTFVVGQAFDTFAQYPLTPNPPQAAKDALLHGVGLAALELVGLAFGSLALGSITSCLWIEQTGMAATIIDRAIAAIATVKAFNATEMESQRANDSFLRIKNAAKMLNRVWGNTSAVRDDGHVHPRVLVRRQIRAQGKCSAGDVMAVFWACLIATSNLQMCIPQFITLANGKFAMVALLTLIGDAPSTPPPEVMSPTSPQSRTLRKITPARCSGELALHNVTFAYPSRPTLPVLSDVSLFLPANEMMFIVGSSGSGKSTVAQLLLRMYEPQAGTISLDEQDVRFLDEAWMRKNVAGVGQQGASGMVFLDGKSVFENVALGLFGDHEVTTREEVEEAPPEKRWKRRVERRWCMSL